MTLISSYGSWSKRPHSKTATSKTATTLLATKTATLYWSKRPHRKDHYQNGQTAFGQNGHKGRITTKTATLHLVETATKGGSLPKRPHCIWSKRPHRPLPIRPHCIWSKRPHRREDHWTSLPRTATLVKRPKHESLPKRPHYRSLARHESRTRVCLLACSRAHFSNDIFHRN